MNAMRRKMQAARRGEEGSALITVMFVAGMMMMAGAFMVYVAGNASHRARRMKQDGQALALAEAGIAHMVANLRTNYSHWVGNTNTGAILVEGYTGTYEVVATDLGGGSLLISSEGAVGAARVTTVLEVLGTAEDERDKMFGAGGSILADDDVTMATGAPRIYGTIHSNGDVLRSGGAMPPVFDDVSAVGVVEIVPVAGNAYPGSARRPIPEFNFEAYREMALNGGIYLEGDQELRGANLQPGNGVVYVNGNVRVRNQSFLHGTLVANGNITIDNRFVQYQVVSNMPALLATGHVDLNNRNNYTGVIYGRLSVDSWNRKYLYGGIITHGWVYIQNRMELFRQSGYPVWDPSVTNDPGVIVGGWIQ